MLPLHLDVAGRRVLVSGGGPAAAGPVRALLAEGADVVVVAPQLCEDLRDVLDAVTWWPRDARAGDVDGAWLVHAATGDAPLDDAVEAAATAARTWCVRARGGSALAPAVLRRDDVVVSVAAGDPVRAHAVAAGLGRALDGGAADLRRAPGGPRAPRGPGRVTLVGGGPGDGDLLTLRGRRRLAEADVVVVDRLAPRSVLAELAPDVQVVDVGKTPDRHPVPQHEINHLLVEAARAGHRVVRLKGGDPYVLGRGGEEVLACREAGVEVEVVPGVTSAFSVPAAAGIPVTHRGTSRCVTVVSGHTEDGRDAVDHATLARLDGTLVVLMGVSTLPSLAAGLLAAGKDPATPVAVVEDGWSPQQRTTTAPLSRIAAVAAAAGVRAPAVVVVGEVVGLAPELAPGPAPALAPAGSGAYRRSS